MDAQEQQRDQEETRNYQQYAQWGREQVGAQIESYPFTSVLLSFGIGLGVGLAVGSALADTINASRRPTSTAERVGRQVLESLSAALPESVGNRLKEWV
jgi:hypothetical protein